MTIRYDTMRCDTHLCSAPLRALGLLGLLCACSCAWSSCFSIACGVGRASEKPAVGRARHQRQAEQASRHSLARCGVAAQEWHAGMTQLSGKSGGRWKAARRSEIFVVRQHVLKAGHLLARRLRRRLHRSPPARPTASPRDQTPASTPRRLDADRSARALLALSLYSSGFSAQFWELCSFDFERTVRERQYQYRRWQAEQTSGQGLHTGEGRGGGGVKRGEVPSSAGFLPS